MGYLLMRHNWAKGFGRTNVSDVTKVYNPLSAFMPLEIEGFDSLAELALDLRWSWNHPADELWGQLDPNLWEHTHNPWIVLKMVSRDRIVQMMNTRSFRNKLDDLLRAKRESAESATWFSRNHSGSSLKLAAYFSMEFMLSEALPIYSGGLGNVAGDQLKAASDLGVPVVGVGLLYQQGYFRQVIDRSGTIARMRESTARLTPQFSATRTVQEYLEDYYLPSATGYAKRAVDKGALALEIANWKKSLSDQWNHLRFGEMKVETVNDEHVFEVEVYFSGINPDHVSVELYADGVNGGEPSIRRMIKGRRLSGVENGSLYKGTAPADRPPKDYTARLVPFHEGVSVPLEAPKILWQR